MSIETSDIFLDPFYADTLTQYGGDTVPYETLVWQRFVGIYNIDVSQPLTDSEKATYQALLSRYKAWGLSMKALSGSALPPSTSNYESCYVLASSLFPNITSVEMKDIWNGFLEKYSLDPNQIKSQDLSALFTNYLKTLYDNLTSYVPPASATKSPEDIYQIALWNRFLEIYGYSARDTSTKNLKTQFSKFVQQYANWHMDIETLQSTNTLPSGTGADFFLSYLNSFYGQLSSQEQTDLWNRFLSTQGLSSNPTDLSSLQKPFVTFINGLQSQKAAFEAATAISPLESAKRTVFNDVMTSLSKMLSVSEQVVITNAAALKIYGDWQKAYTEQMTRAPNLVAVTEPDRDTSTETTLRIPESTDISSWDLSQYTFGYAKISLKDVLSWAASSLLKDPSTPLVFGDPASPMGSYEFSVGKDANGLPAIKETFHIFLKDPQYANDALYSRENFPVYNDDGTLSSYYKEVSQSAYLSMTDANGNPLSEANDPGTLYTIDDWTSALGDKFKDIFTALSTQTPYPNTPDYNVITNLRGNPPDPNNPATEDNPSYYPKGIEGRFLDDLQTWIDPKTGNMMTDTAELQARTGQNTVIQQYVNIIRARRETIQVASSKIQSVLQTARDSINKISSLWTSILEAIGTIMSSLYNR